MTLAESKKRKKHILPKNHVIKNFLIDDDYYSTKNRSLSCGGHCIVESQAFDLGAQWFDNHYDTVKDKCVAVIDRENKRLVVNTSKEPWYDVFFEARKQGYEVFRTIGTIPDWNISLPLAMDCWVLREHAKWLINEFAERWIKPVALLMQGKKNTIWFDIDTVWRCTKEDKNNNILAFIRKYKIAKKPLYDMQLFNSLCYCKPYPTLKDIAKKKVFNKDVECLVAKKKFYSEYCLGWGVVPWRDVDKYFYMPFDKAYFEAMCRKVNTWFTEEQMSVFTTWKDGVIAMRNAMVKHREKYNEELHKKCAKNMNEAIYKGVEDLIARGVYQRLLNTGSTGCYYSTQQYIGYQCTGNRSVDKEVPKQICVSLPYHTYKLWYNDGKIYVAHKSIHINKAKLFWPEIKKAVEFWSPQKIGEGHNVTVPPRFENISHTIAIGVHEKTSWYGRPLGGIDTQLSIAGVRIWLSDIIEFVKYYHYENIFDINFDPKVVIYGRNKG